VRIQATVRLRLFPGGEALEGCRANLRLHASGPSKPPVSPWSSQRTMLPASLLSCGAVALGRNAAAAVGLSARISVCVSFRSGRGLVIAVGWGGRFSGASSLPTRVADARYRVRWFLCLSDTLQEFLKS